MSYSFDLVKLFVNSFGRRNFIEMSTCLSEDFVFDASIIFIEGREKFLKFQQKVDSSYIIIPYEINGNDADDEYWMKFAYDIHFHNRKNILLPAHATMYLSGELIKKVTIKFRDVEEARTIFNQMVRH